MTSISCPKCGKTADIATTELVLPESPTLLALLKGTLNLATCPACQSRILVDTPLVYRDAAEGLFIWLVPGGDWRPLEVELLRMAEEAGRQEEEEDGTRLPLTCRLVLSRRNLVEKIMLFRNGFDDALVEYIKFNLYHHREHPIDPEANELLYDFSATDDEKLMFLVIDRKSGRATAHTHLEMSAYQELAAVYADTQDGREEMRKIFPGPYVSASRMICGDAEEAEAEAPVRPKTKRAPRAAGKKKSAK